MKNPLDTLFGRFMLMTVGLLLLVQLTLLMMVDRDRAGLDALHISRAVMAAQKVRDRTPDLASDVAGTLGISFVDAHGMAAAGCPSSCADTGGPIENGLRELLPAGSHVAIAESGTIWVRVPGSAYGIVIPYAVVPLGRLIIASALMLTFAVVIAIVFAWRMQRPIREMAKAAQEYRIDRIFQQVQMSGPRELRGLIGDFNDMVSELAEADRERAVMLASIAHDLRTPVTRMLVRADLLADQKDRAGFLRDTESMSRIITQFLDFAHERGDTSADVSVDAHCRRNYTDTFSSGEDEADALVKLDLRAGPGFMLPAVDIDRIMTNLVENAMTYGQPPIEVSTSLHKGHYFLVVRDHGPGVPEAELDRVLRPFVRLDTARGGNAHCGLGLAIVRRLVRHHGGTLVISNAPDGGFVTTMKFAGRRHT
ncbi:HAMP domain-containing protein [Trinickia terrae]|uniref:histidine kinase n=1 Tax=Trinickia terrae TaxID=2571161 RepID=A0A4U1I4V3_9BURK|nr:ATP-binding protein [Trinickia terrae]TKC88324.1 HAMP domain-containing protein [Trinickia terrae]